MKHAFELPENPARCECHQCTQARLPQPPQMAELQQGPQPIVRFDDGTDVYLGSFAGGGDPNGAWSRLTLEFQPREGPPILRDYTADDVAGE